MFAVSDDGVLVDAEEADPKVGAFWFQPLLATNANERVHNVPNCVPVVEKYNEQKQ
jgi:hypothetical protein